MALSINITESQRIAARQNLERAVEAARHYDGKEVSSNRLLENLAAFEAYAFQLTANTELAHDASAREAAVAAELLGDDKPLTAMGLFEEAIANFGKRFTANELDIGVVQTEFVFLPTDGQSELITGSGKWIDGRRFENRTEQLLTTLNEHKIYADDLIIYRGSVEPTMMRQQAYNLIQIPRLDREVLVCDQVEEASFIGNGLRGPLFWASYRKDQLQSMDGITRIVHDHQWKNEILKTLFEGGLGIKVKVFVPPGGAYPLSEDLILTKALEYARDHDGQLPTQYSGPVTGLPGQTWNSWDHGVASPVRGLKHKNITSLPHLFRLYGLKIGMAVNPEMIALGIENLKSKGHHGLVIRDEISLTENLILVKALEFAEAHNGKLPGQKGDVPGLPGQKWASWNSCVVNCSRGLTRKGITSLAHLFRLYGLKNGQVENPQVIEKAIQDIKTTGSHNLTIQQETFFTEDLILIKALEYAELNNLRLPTDDSGAIAGMPGQTWSAWNSAIAKCSRGLTRPDLRGLGHLFRLYGLKMATKENPERIMMAIDHLQKTGSHGLIFQDEFILTEDIILNKAIEYTKIHGGKLPAANGSGEVDGMPGQTWEAWHGSIANCNRGLTRENVKGLAHLFRLYGLKVGATENPEAIARALINIETTGNHGLSVVEEVNFNEELVLNKAIEYAAKHAGKLPTYDSGEVPGMPGQKWSAWNAAIRKSQRGFNRQGVNGLAHLYQLCGLKDENHKAIPEVIAQAIVNLREAGTHGLKPIEELPGRDISHKRSISADKNSL